MINPLRSEAEAFRFLIASIVYFGVIVVASVTGGKWVGLGVFVAVSAVAVGWWLHARRDERVTKTVARPHAPGERRILVIANETVAQMQEGGDGVAWLALTVTDTSAARVVLREEFGFHPVAIEDALRTFGADEIIISTHPEGRSPWFERGVVDKARERFAVPITHVVVDLTRESPAQALPEP